jgi:hypothetical protein
MKIIFLMIIDKIKNFFVKTKDKFVDMCLEFGCSVDDYKNKYLEKLHMQEEIFLNFFEKKDLKDIGKNLKDIGKDLKDIRKDLRDV